jgi:CRP-like cAMP-binding protein
MIEAHLATLRRRDELSLDEEAAVRWAVTDTREFGADKIVIRRGEQLKESMLLVTGWAARTKDLRDGQRQISELHIPGDFVDLHGFTLKYLDHNVMTVTACRFAVAPHDRIREVTERYPHLARMWWLSTNMDAARYREWTVSLGRRSAIARMANLFCELLARLEIVNLAQGRGFDFPLTQQELSECLGLTAVHVNRTLQELRRRNLIEVEGRRATILDLEGLQSIAEFDPAYLYLDRQPR